MTAAESWPAWASATQGVVWVLPEVDSTQEAIKRAFAALTTPPEWAACIAEAQTAGRGRHGHAWISAAGQGLWFSLIVPVPNEDEAPPPVALLAAAALRDALRAEGFAVDIKWPNDLWLNEAKVGGVLVEAWRHRDRLYWIIGAGLNWQAPPIHDLTDKLTHTLTNKQGAPSAATGLLVGEPDTPARRQSLAQSLLGSVREVLRAPASWPQRVAALQENHRLWQRRVSVWVQGEKTTEGRAGALTPRGELTLITDAGDSLIIGGSASVREIP